MIQNPYLGMPKNLAELYQKFLLPREPNIGFSTLSRTLLNCGYEMIDNILHYNTQSGNAILKLQAKGECEQDKITLYLQGSGLWPGYDYMSPEPILKHNSKIANENTIYICHWHKQFNQYACLKIKDCMIDPAPFADAEAALLPLDNKSIRAFSMYQILAAQTINDKWIVFIDPKIASKRWYELTPRGAWSILE